MFEIQLPVTFTLLNAIVLHAGSERYLIDAAHVRSSHSTDSIDPQIDVESTSALTLEQLLEQAPRQPPSTFLISCNFKMPNSELNKSVTSQVRELETAQVLVRNLGSHSGRWLGVAGAAEMRDGKVAARSADAGCTTRIRRS
jgi:chemotaxis protein histidine kinase CheA